MKIRLKRTCFALVLALFLLGSIGACSVETPDHSSPKPELLLYDDDMIGGKVSAVSPVFDAAVGFGDTIRVSYSNRESSAVEVRLYEYGLFGSKKAVLSFNVDGNAENTKEYAAKKVSLNGYYILIETSDGGQIEGSLRASQTT